MITNTERIARRATLLASLHGTVLEIGAGSGANFADLAPGVRWLGIEPDARLCRRLARAAASAGHGDAAVRAVAEELPVTDHSVTAVVSTVVLCTVANQERVLAEIQRVLIPGGTFFFSEHVAAPNGSPMRRYQKVAAPITRRFDNGCDPSRETWKAIEAAGFATVEYERYNRGIWCDPCRPGIIGMARTR